MKNIKIIPRTKYINVTLFFLYLKEVGNNSYIDISIIIPAVKAKIILNNNGVIMFFKKIQAIIAPKVSEKPDIKVYVKAFNLLFVE